MSVFDERAAQWELTGRRVKLAGDVVSAVIKYANPEKGMDIADFGTGTGLILLGLAEYAGTLTGYDSSEGMLDVLRQKAEKTGTPIKTVFMDIDNNFFPPESADIVTASMVVHHLAHPQVFICKAHEALRKGGRLCVADVVHSGVPFHDTPDPTVMHEGFGTAEIQRSFLECGFRDVEVHEASTMEKERDGKKVEFKIFLAVGVK